MTNWTLDDLAEIPELRKLAGELYREQFEKAQESLDDMSNKSLPLPKTRAEKRKEAAVERRSAGKARAKHNEKLMRKQSKRKKH